MADIWVPLKETKADPSLPALFALARAGSNDAIRALEMYVTKVGRQEEYILTLIPLVFSGRDFEVTTGPNLFRGNEVRHYFRTNELFDLVFAYPMQRLKAIEHALRGIMEVE